jgi:hypothetical protein
MKGTAATRRVTHSSSLSDFNDGSLGERDDAGGVGEAPLCLGATLLLLLAGLGGIMLLGEQFEAHRLRAFIFNFEIARHRGSADV